MNLKVSRVAPGFYAGSSGTTHFGTDLENPWGCMRHTFWPRCIGEGTISTQDGLLDFDKGEAVFIHALQGMKPHHAAATWNFVNFQGPQYSAVMMEFTTPPSYGSTVVNVGCIAKNDEIVIAGCKNTATHTATVEDPVNGWPEPTEARYTWSGAGKDGEAIEATIEGPLGERADCVDIMAEVPGFIKTIIAGAAGTKPYLYQVRRPFLPSPSLSRSACLLTNILSVSSQPHPKVEDRRPGNRRGGYFVHRGHFHHRPSWQ